MQHDARGVDHAAEARRAATSGDVGEAAGGLAKLLPELIDKLTPDGNVPDQGGLLDKLGYKLTYTELPEWGHAYTDSINERLVWPWFAALPG